MLTVKQRLRACWDSGQKTGHPSVTLYSVGVCLHSSDVKERGAGPGGDELYIL